jgi:mannitol/fructose-specific phosphotransferase system IIA component (Ntr-type)
VETSTELLSQPDALVLDLVATTRNDALRLLHAELIKSSAVNDHAQLWRDLLERAELSSVCIAPEVALPHARTLSVDRLVLGVARVRDPGVMFDAEHPSVRLMFMIGTPRQRVEEYLRMVAAITRRLRKPDTIPALLGAPTADEFRAVLGRGAA